MTDWSPVGSPYSLAGDPAEVHAFASGLADRVEAWALVADRLGQLDPGAVWAGRAVEAFDDARARVREVVVRLADMADGARRALDRWANELDAAQEAGRLAREHARDADAEIARAQRGLDEMAAFERRDALAAGAGAVPQPWPGPDWPTLLEVARDRRAAAQRAFERAEDDHDGAARAATAAIQDCLERIEPVDRLGEWSRHVALASGLVSKRGELAFLRTDRGLVWADPARADELVARLRREGRFAALVAGDLAMAPAEVESRLAAVRALGLDPTQYAALLRVHRRQRALAEAGIDWGDWDLQRGAVELQPIIVAVYDYYGRLYREHPELEWAGMANLVGPSFAAGFVDLGSWGGRVEHTTSGFDALIDAIYDASGLPQTLRMRRDLPPGVSDANLRDLVNLPAEEFAFYEETFLRMQQEIFLDIGAMHQAWVDGGLPAIEEMHAAGLFDRDDNPKAADRALRAWRLTDRGRRQQAPADLHEAAESLAFREQHDIIQDDYEKMLAREPSGAVVTELMTSIGQVSVPGTRRMSAYGPDLNVARFEDRWPYFLADTLPAYIDLLDEGVVDELTADDMTERVDEFRVHRRIDNLVLDGS